MKNICHIQSLLLKNRVFLGWLLCSLLFQSCFVSDKSGSNVLNIIKDNGKKIEDNFTGYFLVIPNEGCYPCINHAWKLAHNNLKNSQIYFVVTTDFDFKRTKINFPKAEESSDNFVLDSKKKCKEFEIPNNQLFLLDVRDGQLASKTVLSPENIQAYMRKIQNDIDSIK